MRVYGQHHRIVAFCCPHFGDERGHDADLWIECLEEIHRSQHVLGFGLGDYLDFTRTTYRAPLRAVGGEDDKFFEEMDTLVMRGLVEPFIWQVRKRCPSFADKVIGLIEGNHHYRFRDGTTSTQQICRLLGVRYLGLSAWVRITAYRSKGKDKMGTGHNLNIVLNHSVSGSGALPASLAAANRKLVGWRGVDIFLTGNDHQLGHETRQEISCTTAGLPRMMQNEVIVGKCGSFQKGYLEGAVNNDYVEKKFLKPSHLGYLAFDAHLYHRSLSQGDRKLTGRATSPETWRFSNFSA